MSDIFYDVDDLGNWRVANPKQPSKEQANIEVDNAELAYLNKEIDKVKNQLAQRQSDYESVPLPKTRVGWSSYIANNDRGMLDKYQDAERAWYNAKKQSEYAQKLADKQRVEQADYNRDEWQLNLSKAQNELNAANEALRIAKKNGDEESINAATQAANNAAANVNYWSKRLNVESAANVYTPKNNGPEGGNDELLSAESVIATAKAEFKKNLTQAEINAQIKALTPYANQNGEAATLISDYKGKKSSESIDFDNAVLKEAKKGKEDIWDLIGKDAQQTLIDEARAKLNKGAK